MNAPIANHQFVSCSCATKTCWESLVGGIQRSLWDHRISVHSVSLYGIQIRFGIPFVIYTNLLDYKINNYPRFYDIAEVINI